MDEYAQWIEYASRGPDSAREDGLLFFVVVVCRQVDEDIVDSTTPGCTSGDGCWCRRNDSRNA